MRLFLLPFWKSLTCLYWGISRLTQQHFVRRLLSLQNFRQLAIMSMQVGLSPAWRSGFCPRRMHVWWKSAQFTISYDCVRLRLSAIRFHMAERWSLDCLREKSSRFLVLRPLTAHRYPFKTHLPLRLRAYFGLLGNWESSILLGRKIAEQLIDEWGLWLTNDFYPKIRSNYFPTKTLWSCWGVWWEWSTQTLIGTFYSMLFLRSRIGLFCSETQILLRLWWKLFP